MRDPKHDNSRIIRDPISGKITDWTDISGQAHPPPVDLGMISESTMDCLRDDDAVRVPMKRPEIDNGPNPLWLDAAILLALMALVAAVCLYVAHKTRPKPVDTRPAIYRDWDQIEFTPAPTFDAYQFPPPPNAEDRKRLGLPERTP